MTKPVTLNIVNKADLCNAQSLEYADKLHAGVASGEYQSFMAVAIKPDGSYAVILCPVIDRLQKLGILVELEHALVNVC